MKDGKVLRDGGGRHGPGGRLACSKNEGAVPHALQGGTGSPGIGAGQAAAVFSLRSHWILGESSSFWEACKFLSPSTKSGVMSYPGWHCRCGKLLFFA